ncbi:MAG: hypothetical protein U9N46_00960 [Euryarchaeota archaeon]|nr:hypothetical protein [Euryarchaeota archaeon]
MKGKSALIITVLFVSIMSVVPSCSGGVAISGSFYSHDYVLAQGEQISSNDIYVVAFNKADKRVRVDVEYEAPEFIDVGLSSESCFLEPDSHERIYITLKAHDDAVPGNYTVKVIMIINEVEGDLPIKVLTSAAQEAKVEVAGDYATVNVAAVDPVGNIASNAHIRLYHGDYEMANASGELEKRVVPGTYTAKAYLLGEEVASEEFELEPYEEKKVELLIRSVYFEVFDALPAKNDAGELGYVYTVAVVKNVYMELPDTSIIITVSGATSDTFTVSSFPHLPLERTEVKYNYIPMDGWKSGKYEFTAKVVSGNTVYAVSPTQTVDGAPEITKNSMLLIVAVVAIAMIAVLGLFFYMKKKKNEEEEDR